MIRIKTFIIVVVFSLAVYAQEFSEKKEIGPGVTFYTATFENGPMTVKITEIDLTEPDTRIEAGIAHNTLGKGGERTQDYIRANQGNSGLILSGVNADFFGGKPHQAENSIVIKGEMAKGTTEYDRSLIAVTSENKPHIEKYKFNGYTVTGNDTLNISGLNIFGDGDLYVYNRYIGDTLHIPAGYYYTRLKPVYSVQANESNEYVVTGSGNDSAVVIRGMDYVVLKKGESLESAKGNKVNMYLGTKPELKNIYTLSGGLPELVRDGKRPESYIGIEKLTSEGFIAKNPRTAVGFTADSTKMFFVAADGRQKGYSVGMTLYELSDFMIGLGCDYVLNLDGGGSTTLTIRDSVANSPSDSAGARPVHNYLMVSSHREPSELFTEFKVSNDPMYLRENGKTKIEIKAVDKWGYTYDNLGSMVKYNVEGPAGYVSPDSNKVYMLEAGPGNVKAELGKLESEQKFKAYK